MQDIGEAFSLAFALIFTADSNLIEIVSLSLYVSLTAVLIACAVGLPLGGLMAVGRFPGRAVLITIINALMGMPPVVVGLIVYLALSRSGPFGWLQFLYTPAAMIIAQIILVLPIVAALSRQIIEDLYEEYDEQFRSLSVPRRHQIAAMIWDARFSLVTAALAGFGRAIAEIGAVILVGGNINHLTRVMTTAIALETSKGDLPLALALGIILLGIAFVINAVAMGLQTSTARYSNVG